MELRTRIPLSISRDFTVADNVRQCNLGILGHQCIQDIDEALVLSVSEWIAFGTLEFDADGKVIAI